MPGLWWGIMDGKKKIPRKVKSQTTKKAVYRIRNWATYNQSLVQRGSITMRISREVLANWLPQPGAVRTRGRRVPYSDQAISSLMLLKAIYHLLYLQTVGFGQSAMDVMRVKARMLAEC